MDLDTIVSTLQAMIRFATPITLAALAGVYSERAGVVNIATEGMMLASACVGFLASLYSFAAFGQTGPALTLGLIAALLTGLLLALLHAVVSIRYRTDQIISGTVINILAVGATGYIYRAYLATGAPTSPGAFPYLSELPGIGLLFRLLEQIPLLGPILFRHKPIAFLMLILVLVTHYVLFHTTWGLRTRAVGEHPKAADTLGVNVYWMRYVNVLVGGLMAGLGGAWFTLEQVGIFTPSMTAGRGFIGLAAMIFGKWSPIGALGAASLFGLAEAIQPLLQIFFRGFPYQFFSMIPYIITIIVLAGVVGRALPPAADGQPYEQA